jgi:hypothetical protein
MRFECREHQRERISLIQDLQGTRSRTDVALRPVSIRPAVSREPTAVAGLWRATLVACALAAFSGASTIADWLLIFAIRLINPRESGTESSRLGLVEPIRRPTRIRYLATTTTGRV